MPADRPTNPFRYGGLALGEAFTDREDELAELESDVVNGQDVVVFAPRRYGKTSLVRRAAERLHRRGVLVAQVDLMTTPTRQMLAERLAKAIHDGIATRLLKVKERTRVFSGLRVAPSITVNPDTGALSFSFQGTVAPTDLDDTLQHLLELPAQLAGERGRRALLVLDEFQEVADIDPGLPKLMRAVFQGQPDVAHVYLGSKRHMMERIFSDANEPFWRSAKQIELGVIAPERFAGHIARLFEETGRAIRDDALSTVLDVTKGHPYATQELCYFVWERTQPRRAADVDVVREALQAVLRSEHAHFSLVWDRASGGQRRLLQALAEEPGRPLADAYRRRHGLPAASTTQKALDALQKQELVARIGGDARIVEPFLALWIRDMAG